MAFACCELSDCVRIPMNIRRADPNKYSPARALRFDLDAAVRVLSRALVHRISAGLFLRVANLSAYIARFRSRLDGCPSSLRLCGLGNYPAVAREFDPRAPARPVPAEISVRSEALGFPFALPWHHAPRPRLGAVVTAAAIETSRFASASQCLAGTARLRELPRLAPLLRTCRA